MARKARDRKRQTKINFSPAVKSSPTAIPSTMPSTRNATSSTRAPKPKMTESAQGSPSRTSRPTAIYSSSEDDIAIGTRRGMSLGMPIKNTQNGMFGSSDVDMVMSDTSEDELERQNEQVKGKIVTRKRRRVPESDESDDSGPEVTVVRAKRRRQHSPLIELSAAEETDRPRRKERRSRRRQSTPDDDEDDSDVIEVIPARKRKHNRHQQQSKSDGHDDEESDAIDFIPARKRKHARRQTSPEAEKSPQRSGRRKSSRKEDTEESSDEASQPRSKRRRRARRPVTPSDSDEDDEEDEDESEDANANATEDEDDDEKEDLQEDLAFLRSSPLPDRGKLRSTHEKPKNERQKALEALKRRRAGTNEPSSSATPSRSRKVVIESDSDSELEIIKEEPESGEEASEPDDEGNEVELDRDANALDMFLEDENDEAFIDNDVDAIIGEPVLGPDEMETLVMNRITSSKPKELFSYAVEWMVMKKIHPAFDSTSLVYDATFRKLDDEVKGLANSKFSSSAWTIDFTRALRARPNLNIMELTRAKKDIMDAHCEACNRRNHPASDELMFTGQPYDKETLEPIDNDSDSDESELSALSEEELNGEKPTYDAQGTRIPPESKTFTLGSTCKANAQVAHTLHHWRYHLYSWVKDYLAREGHLTAEKIVQRDGWTDKKRHKAAEKIIAKMEENGEMRKLYHLYKDQMTYASEVRHDQRGWRSRG